MSASFQTAFVRAPWHVRRDTLELSGGERWYLVQALARQEARADFQLALQHFRVFLPVFTKTIRHARKFRVVKAPIFSGYMFVGLDLARDQWRSINGTFGVARIVACQDRPSPVPRGLIEALLDRTDDAGETSLTYTFRPGDSVRLRDGPFANQLATLDRLDAHGRVRVLLEIMGGSVGIVLMNDALEPANKRRG
jgi:transcription elongation factor/antiterminator RfaH